MRALAPRRLASLLLVLALVPGTVAAQNDMPERGQLWQVEWMDVPPANMQRFHTLVTQVNEAATEAALPAEFSWNVWSNGTQIALSMPVTSWASFDDPAYFIKHFQGHAAAMQKLESAMNGFGAAGVMPSRSEIWEAVPSWGRQGHEYDQDDLLAIEMWYLPGHEDAIDASMKELVGFFGEPGEGLTMQGFRVRSGDVGRVVFMVFPEDLSDFYGAGSLENYLAESGREQEWSAVQQHMNVWLKRMDQRLWNRQTDLSFQGTGSN